MLFYINNIDNKGISGKMDLAISNPSDNKALMCQGRLGDAYVKSKYYGWALISKP